MPKNIVVLSDGTGQEGGKSATSNSNVYKLYNMLEDRTDRQAVFYDPGIGTGWRKITGNVGGAGMSGNIRQAYRFIFDHYQAGDRIYLIGFSRGAATVRSLAGFIHHFGILPLSRPDLIKRAYKIYKTRAPLTQWKAKRIIKKLGLLEEQGLVKALYYGDFDEEQNQIDDSRNSDLALAQNSRWRWLPNVLATALSERKAKLEESEQYYVENIARPFLSAHTDGQGNPLNARLFVRAFKLERRARAFVAASSNQWAPVHFLGCFDTVPALGLPSLRHFDALINLIPMFQHKFHNFSLSASVKHASQALAIDDERRAFAPAIWDRYDEEKQTVNQVWFTGMHTDVGGGYFQRGLADITLGWMIREAHGCGLLIFAGHRESFLEDCTDVMHNSRGKPLTKIYIPKVRSWDLPGVKPRVHESVQLRTRANSIKEWTRNGIADAKGESYQPWILGGDPENKAEKFGVEPWKPYDHHEIVALQEPMWERWIREMEAKQEARVRGQQDDWKKLEADGLRDPNLAQVSR